MARANDRPDGAKVRWQRTIARWERSGLSAREFCRRAGVSEWSFYSWRRRLTGRKGHGRAPAREAAAPVAREARSSSAFVPLRLVAASELTVQAGVLEIALRGGHVLRVAGPCEPAALAALARALAES